MLSSQPGQPPRRPDPGITVPEGAGTGLGHELRESAQWRKLEAVLDKLDAHAKTSPQSTKRRTTRYRYRRFRVPVRVYHPGGTIIMRHVHTRDLSAEGLAFLHNGYLHVGTQLDLTLRRLPGPEGEALQDTVHGTVVHCLHVGGSWHTVGVRLEGRIFPQLYVDIGAAIPAPEDEQAQAEDAEESAEAESEAPAAEAQQETPADDDGNAESQAA